MMRRFRKEELDTLSKYEKQFYCATTANYVRNMGGRELLEIKKIYDEATGGDYRLNNSCAHCMFTFIKAVAVKYYADKKEYEEKAAEFAEVIDGLMNMVPDGDEPTPTEGTKTKNNKNKVTNK